MNPSKSTGDKFAFFRQSGWLVIATVLGGVFMSAVHIVVSKPMEPAEYAVFNTLLRVFLLMGFPAGGLQVMFARQAAAAISDEEIRRLAQTTRAVIRATFLIWLTMAAMVFVFRTSIINALKIANPAAVWVTVALGLASLWSPLCKGILQGRQNFAGLGWVMILDGVGRFMAIVVIVQLGGQAAGGMTGALLGQIVSLALGAWLVRKIIHGRGASFEWGTWLSEVIPLTFGVGVVLFMCSADVVYVQSVVSKDQSVFYAPAAMIGLAMISFTTPLAAVMFPKIVDSAARIQKTNALRHALATTTLLGAAAALACTLFPKLPLQIIFFRKPAFWTSAALIPWFAWSLVPLILSNVLINNLLARRRFVVVPWSVAVAIGYGAVLLFLREKLGEYSAQDTRNLSALVQRVQSHADPPFEFLWSHLPPEKQAELTQTNTPPIQTRLALLEILNQLRSGRAVYHEDGRLGTPGVESNQHSQRYGPTEAERKALQDWIAHDAFSPELIPAELFRGFKLVVGTLGVFSALLLLAAMWCTFRNPRAGP